MFHSAVYLWERTVYNMTVWQKKKILPLPEGTVEGLCGAAKSLVRGETGFSEHWKITIHWYVLFCLHDHGFTGVSVQ